MVRVLEGRKVVLKPEGWLEEALAGRERVVVDVGAGDGLMAWRRAREEADTLVVALDPTADRLGEGAAKASRKPTRGGATNALFLVTSIEQAPPSLHGATDHIDVFYPWGTLLGAFVLPDEHVLRAVSALGSQSATFEVVLNRTVLEDDEYMQRLGFPVYTEDRLRGELLPAMERTGFVVEGWENFTGGAGRRSSWERRLVAGAGRGSLRLRGRIQSPDQHS